MPEFADKRVECIPYGIDFPAEADERPRDASGPLRVVYVGRMVELQKRVSRLVAVIRQLAARQAPVEFTLVGSGPEEAQVRRELAGIASARCLGEVPNGEIAGILREQDVFLLLSDFEGLPLSLLEAMGHGVVPVVSDLESGIRDLVTDERGIRVPVGSVEAAVEALLQLAANRPALAQRAARCRAVARAEYSADAMARRYLDLLADATGNPMWPPTAEIPVPLGVRPPWLFRGLPRRVRRLLRASLSRRGVEESTRAD
jgi:glycosyltransferase involved in cell wall biosynthesis